MNMNVALLFIAIVLSWYIANVISCAIICEVYKEAEIAKGYVFLMPLISVLVFFHFLRTERSDSIPRYRMALSYLFFPGKNVAVAECCAAMCKDRKRKVVYDPIKQYHLVPRISSCADFFGRKMSNSYFMQ